MLLYFKIPHYYVYNLYIIYYIYICNNTVLLNYLALHDFSHSIRNAEHRPVSRYYKVCEIYYTGTRGRLSFYQFRCAERLPDVRRQNIFLFLKQVSCNSKTLYFPIYCRLYENGNILPRVSWRGYNFNTRTELVALIRNLWILVKYSMVLNGQTYNVFCVCE